MVQGGRGVRSGQTAGADTPGSRHPLGDAGGARDLMHGSPSVGAATPSKRNLIGALHGSPASDEGTRHKRSDASTPLDGNDAMKIAPAGGSCFTSLPPAVPDAIMQLREIFTADPSPDKLSLGLGVYRTDKNRPYLLETVQLAEERVRYNTIYPSICHLLIDLEPLSVYLSVYPTLLYLYICIYIILEFVSKFVSVDL